MELVEDPPPAPPPKAGDVSGVIRPGGKVADLRAVSRMTGKTFQPASFDKATGKFLFKGLPGDATYDVCFRTADGRAIEGLDLDFVDARMLRLADARRRQLGLPSGAEHAFDSQDVQELQAYVRDLKDFMEIRRILYLRGHGRRATMLVELMRAREFYHQESDQVIWRIELWYFENEFGGWDRLPNQEIVLDRRRIPEAQWRQISVEYYPSLSAHVAADGSCPPVEFEIPAQGDPSRGRAAGTPIEMQTPPHVDGLDVPPPADPSASSGPSTQPATAPAK